MSVPTQRRRRQDARIAGKTPANQDGLSAAYKQVVGVDADFVAAATVTDSDATISGLPPGSTVRIRVTAVNDAGESQPSATVEIVIPVNPAPVP